LIRLKLWHSSLKNGIAPEKKKLMQMLNKNFPELAIKLNFFGLWRAERGKNSISLVLRNAHTTKRRPRSVTVGLTSVFDSTITIRWHFEGRTSLET